MLDLLNRRIRQIHAALAGLGTDDLSTIQLQIDAKGTMSAMVLDFNQNSDEIILANQASLLIANIACIKDHLNAWCDKQSAPRSGDALINRNRAVALIHDLWNIEKHGELNRRPRSGCTPVLTNIRTALTISAGSAAGGGAMASIDSTGKIVSQVSDGGKVSLQLNAEIIDETGKIVGCFVTTCMDAIEAWSNALRDAGAPLAPTTTNDVGIPDITVSRMTVKRWVHSGPPEGWRFD